ncbi:MAG: tRNA (N6-threonylcarbamoyladenosine(37)-N6)-methyltransferase TrmO [Bdellovibrionaceae bacterium]|nr:tRNA (N6-threonylcarbamoyladenosine(37)-N6)-methyltransferase TrmO [Pseudobdellovibrionaceae bacterium]
MNQVVMTPIGTYHSNAKRPYEARRQGSLDDSEEVGVIELAPGQGFEQALEDLVGFDRIWLLYTFHENHHWKPKTLPPRGSRHKRGVFATRSPYRPNPLGMSSVKLVGVDGLRVFVQESDLLDGTPVLDIKPYLPYADAFPTARIGWLEGVEQTAFTVTFSERGAKQIDWLSNQGSVPLRAFLQSQLEFEPTDEERKRVSTVSDGLYEIAYRTWRARFQINEATRQILVTDIDSAYALIELASVEDPYGDKALHRSFFAAFGRV